MANAASTPSRSAAPSPSPSPPPLLKDKHIAFVRALDAKRDGLMYHMTEHLRMNGVYWGLCALALLDADDIFSREDVIRYIRSTYDDPEKSPLMDSHILVRTGLPNPFPPAPGGFAPFPGHDSHIHSTLSAIQVLAMKDALDIIDKPAIVKCTLPACHCFPPCPFTFFVSSYGPSLLMS